MSKPPTPTTVRVARWAAVAALITALGSVFNTIWTEKPWWKEEAPAPIVAEAYTTPPGIHRVRPAPAPRSVPAGTMEAIDSATENLQMVMSAAPVELSWWQKTKMYLKYHPVATWLVAGSSIVGLGWILSEFFFHRKKKIDEDLSNLR